MPRRVQHRIASVFAAAFLFGCALARAEAPPAAAPASAPTTTVPPQIEAPPSVPYPAGAEGDAEVLLVLTVQKDGVVRSVEVAEGKEPFASAAKDAAAAFHFQPATRDGKPVAARIRFAVRFHQEIVTQDAPSLPEPSVAPPDAKLNGAPNVKNAEAAALQVDVRGEKPAPSVSTLTRTEVRQIPGTFGDPFRAIEVLPGVAPIVSGLPYFYVRGAPPGNVGYFLDGVRVPYLFHVGVGPSVVNPAMVESVSLHAGGYPAQYGRFAGAIVTAETTAPRDDLHGEGNIRLFDAGAMVETGFAGGKGTALLGGRYSYTGGLLSLISPSVGLDYRDYQARVTYDLTPRDRIGLVAFGAYDLLSQTSNGITSIVFGSEFYRLDARYEHKLGASGVLRWGTTLGFDQTRVGEQRNARDSLFGTRVSLVQPLSSNLVLHAGLDAQFDNYRADKRRWADPEDPDTIAYDGLFPERYDTALGTWVDVAWQMDPRVKLTPGLRFDAFRSGGATATGISPRLAMVVDVTPHIRILHAFGVATQPPSFVIPLPGLSIGSLQGGLQTSLQSSAGVEVELPLAITATLSLFDNVFLNMSDTLSVQRPRDALTKEPRSLGSSRGLEFYIRRRFTSRLGGFLSYTLSESTRSLGSATFPSAFDRRHILNTALAYDLGRKVRVGARVTFYTGAPALGGPNVVAPTDPANPPRNPSFFRLDLRVEKRFQLSQSRWLSLVVEMVNATLNKEVVSGQEIGPISIPSIGLEGGF